MKTNGRLMMTITALLGSTQAAHAESISTIYSSGWLVLTFFGLCALIVTFQLVPALIMLAGSLRALFSDKDAEKVRHTK